MLFLVFVSYGQVLTLLLVLLTRHIFVLFRGIVQHCQIGFAVHRLLTFLGEEIGADLGSAE